MSDEATPIHPQHAINAIGRALDLERAAHQQALIRESILIERATKAEAALNKSQAEVERLRNPSPPASP